MKKCWVLKLFFAYHLKSFVFFLSNKCKNWNVSYEMRSLSAPELILSFLNYFYIDEFFVTHNLTAIFGESYNWILKILETQNLSKFLSFQYYFTILFILFLFKMQLKIFLTLNENDQKVAIPFFNWHILKIFFLYFYYF